MTETMTLRLLRRWHMPAAASLALWCAPTPIFAVFRRAADGADRIGFPFTIYERWVGFGGPSHQGFLITRILWRGLVADLVLVILMAILIDRVRRKEG